MSENSNQEILLRLWVLFSLGFFLSAIENFFLSVAQCILLSDHFLHCNHALIPVHHCPQISSPAIIPDLSLVHVSFCISLYRKLIL